MNKFFLSSSLALVSIMILFGFKFSNTDENYESETYLESLMQSGDWGYWQTTDCYRYLRFRVKYRGENYDGTKHKWAVQFDNQYSEKIYFSWEVYDSKPYSPRSTNRTDLDPNETSDGIRDYYMANSSSIYIYVDKVRFGKDGLQEYYGCDR